VAPPTTTATLEVGRVASETATATLEVGRVASETAISSSRSAHMRDNYIYDHLFSVIHEFE